MSYRLTTLFSQTKVRKKIIYYLFFGFYCLLFLFTVTQIVDHSVIRPITIKNVDQENITNWNIESINIGSRYVAISGWAFIPGEIISQYELTVVLKEVNSEESFEIPTVLIEMESINEIYDDEFDYSQSGFFARINNNFINLREKSYEIYLKFYHNGHKFFIYTDEILSIQ